MAMSVLTKAPSSFSLRWIVAADLPALLPLVNLCPTLEWTAEDFRECFRSLDTIGKVVTVDGTAVGFVIYKLDQSLQEVFIKHIAVRPEWQRCGAGRTLIRSLDPKLSQAYEQITAIVPESNLAALYLLRDCGYKARRVLRDWFSDEDAYLMQKTRAEAQDEVFAERSCRAGR
jgi:ribosomal protein S18 acetylase RimI-like enzyme